jgi:glycosyltransferase involved in cell wall biosynthesis
MNRSTDRQERSSAAIEASVVIAVHNARHTINETLRCLFASTFPVPYEVVVVDDASTDGTAELCEAFAVRLIRLETNQGPARARNIGIRHTRGEVIVFLDSDVTFPPDLVGRMLGLMADPGVAGVGTFTSPQPLNAGFYPRYFAMNYYYSMLRAFDAGALNAICTRCGTLRRSVFDAVGGFDERYREPSIEDYHFSLQLQGRYRIQWDKTMVHSHHYPDTLAKIWRRYYRNTRAMYWSMRESKVRYVSPYREDLYALILMGCAVPLLIAGVFNGSALVAAGCLVAAAGVVKTRLLRYFLHEEGVLFCLKGWFVYLLTCIPIVAGAASGAVSRYAPGAPRRAHGQA